MKLRLPLNRSIGAGLVALGAGLTREATEHLAGLAADPVESVHRSRVALKRARSTLRLLEKAGADWAIMPRHRLTQLARLMSVAREAAVASALADSLSRRLPEPERSVARLLIAKKNRLVPPEAEDIGRALFRETRELTIAPAPDIRPARLCDLVRLSLDRAHRRYRDAAAKTTLAAVHEWRKAVIILRDQSAFATARWPRGAGAAHPLLVQFARQLGHRGDLALLERRLAHLRVSPALQPARRALQARWARQRESATRQAMHRWPRLESRLARLLAG